MSRFPDQEEETIIKVLCPNCNTEHEVKITVKISRNEDDVEIEAE